MSKGGGKGRVSNELVAASCAAVLAVYAAGYWRTREAADRLEAQAQVRRPSRVPAPPPAAETVLAPALVTPAPVIPSAPVELSPAEKPAEAAAPEKKTEAKASAAVPTVPAPTEKATGKPASEVARAPAATTTTPPPAILSVPLPEEIPAAAPVAAAPPVAAAVPEPSNDAWIDALPKPADRWKDGIYSGWGYSNHGDIEAEVVIKQGRIVSSRISSCATRYPCDVIETILKQPVWRQSPEVDNVSRATESANAYYYAVTEALKQALVQDTPTDATAATPASVAPSP